MGWQSTGHKQLEYTEQCELSDSLLAMGERPVDRCRIMNCAFPMATLLYIYESQDREQEAHHFERTLHI